MNKFKVVATDFENRTFQLKHIQSLEILSGIDSPASTFKMSAALSDYPSGINTLDFYFNDEIKFSGKVDLQETTLSQGIIFRLEARCKGGKTLDNEALPCTLWGANLTTVFLRHISQFGFTLESSLPTGTLPVFTVHKGMSQWEVFSLFCRRLHGVQPYILGGTVYVKNLTPSPPILSFSNTQEGEKYTSFSHTIVPYKIISKVYLRDENGQYSSWVKNSAAKYYDVTRERFFLPPVDFIEGSGTGEDANLQIKRSMADSQRWQITIPKLLFLNLGDTVAITDPAFSKSRLIITEIGQKINASGSFTILTLKDSTYL